ncbi:unnamed protein product [Periconia digitata]|uniref:Uncharacterized protein n=1 Tax=Periconia digitata TaxID=1303443 RepID=A0A9W4UTT5_9PLEO|nr:unnamed protein product [Periconia digitata]
MPNSSTIGMEFVAIRVVALPREHPELQLVALIDGGHWGCGFLRLVCVKNLQRPRWRWRAVCSTGL